MRGRKNHGVRQKRWAKYQKRWFRRQRRWLHSRALYWKQSHRPYSHAYIRPLPAFVPQRYMLRLKDYIKKPKHVRNRSDGPIQVYHPAEFLARPSPHTKNYWHPFTHIHYPPDYRVMYTYRRHLFYGKRLHRETKADVICAAAANWYHLSQNLHILDPHYYVVGWPAWDPKHRLPVQPAPGIPA
jgi:hypothetical protein